MRTPNPQPGPRQVIGLLCFKPPHQKFRYVAMRGIGAFPYKPHTRGREPTEIRVNPKHVAEIGPTLLDIPVVPDPEVRTQHLFLCCYEKEPELIVA